VPSFKQIFAISIVCSTAALALLGNLLHEHLQSTSADGNLPEPWPVATTIAGVLLGSLIGLLSWLFAARREVEVVANRGAFTSESLAVFLTQMGYEVSTVALPQGPPQYLVQLQRGGASFPVSIDISPNRANLWLIVTLRALPPGLANLEGRLVSLLQASWDHAPVFFSYSRAANQLCLMRMLENRDVSPSRFRAALDEFLDVACRTYYLWETKLWDSAVPWKPPDGRLPGAAPVELIQATGLTLGTMRTPEGG
jgi:hypothetical protein